MSTLTSRLGLLKPDGSDLVDELTQLSQNWDRVDSYSGGTLVCTSSTRPTGSNRFTGLKIYETDTKSEQIWDGANWILISGTKVVLKPSNESVTSSITLQNDNDLFIALPIGKWAIQALYHLAGSGTGDFQSAWTFSGTFVDAYRSILAPQIGSTDNLATLMRASTGHAFGTALACGLESTLNSRVQEDIYLHASVAGTLQLQWSQNVSSGTPTTMIAGSRLYVTSLH